MLRVGFQELKIFIGKSTHFRLKLAIEPPKL